MAKRDYYEVLGVDRNVSAADLKKAYHKAALQYHPDRQQGKSDAEKKEAEEKFKEAAEAYEVLSDPDKRARYDQYGHAAFEGGGGYQSADMSDLLRHFAEMFGGGGGFGFGFDDLFGGGSRRGGASRTRRGKDLLIHLNLTLAEVAHGVDKKLKIPHKVSCHACRGTGAKDGTALETCPTCHGKGVEVRMQRTPLGIMQSQQVCHTCGGSGKHIKQRCPECNGAGLLQSEDVVEVSIPAGVASGMQLTKQGAGDDAPGGGVPGDLYIEIEEIADPNLKRVGDDLVYNLMIDFSTAALGGKVEVPTVDGHVLVTIDPGTQPGSVLRLRGKGIPHLRARGNGDLLVNVMVYVPQSLNSDERAAIEQLAKGPHVRPSEAVKKTLFQRLRHLFDK